MGVCPATLGFDKFVDMFFDYYLFLTLVLRVVVQNADNLWGDFHCICHMPYCYCSDSNNATLIAR